jgi:4'-phosphopantetheinyl transferase EntD
MKIPGPHDLRSLSTVPTIVFRNQHPTQEAFWLAQAKRLFPDAHPNRQMEWALGRVAWEVSMRQHGRPTSHVEWVGHQQIAHSPVRFSISHTAGWAGAWITTFDGVGLDIELRSRMVSPEIERRIHHARDMALTPLELWTVKEAVYKSLPRELQEKIWLNSIAVTDGEFEAQGMRGAWQLHPHEELTVAKAWR